jgi:hypothetical protein
MSRTNSFAVNESVLVGRDKLFPYRSLMGMINSAEWNVFFDDFKNSVATNVPNGWMAAIIDVGATLTNFETSAAANANGIVRITSDAASEGVAIYLPKQVFLSGKKWFMEVSVRTAAATDSEIQFGLTDRTAVTNPEDLYTTAANSYASFGVFDGSATPVLTYDKANAGPVTNTPAGSSFAMANNTLVTWGLFYNGSSSASTTGELIAYVNGSEATRAGTRAQIPDNVLLSPFIGARGGDGAIGTIDFDYVRFAYQR